jgi:DNA-binding response OmpR family regulator
MEATAKKILVVDDERRICENVEKILSKNNYEVIHADNAQEAMEKMAEESFSLLISDIVMPGMNGLELLRLVKNQWPLTKALMMTAYASTDTAVKAIRLGAMDYIPKPFTPDELRTKVSQALAGELIEISAPKQEKEAINLIDLDVPFDREEVAKYTGEAYAKQIGPSDIPIAEAPQPETLEHYCMVGDMVCDIYKKLGATCKGGIKTSECPQKKAKAKKAAAAKGKKVDAKKLIGIDMPFNYDEVIAVTGPEYVSMLYHEGVSFVPYEALKKNVARLTAEKNDVAQTAEKKKVIDVDAPFDAEEVAKYTGEDYAKSLLSSDMPVVETPSAEMLAHFCQVGDMVCDIYKKLGGTCKGGLKTAECPQKKAQAKKAAKQKAVADVRKLIGIDMPFDYEEVAAVTGPEYAAGLYHDGVTVMPYEALKQNVARMMAERAETPQAYADYPGLPAEPAYKNILVIDDEVAVNNNIRKILSKKNYHVDQAVTKAEALEKLESRPYKVVLLDLRIPGVKGLELLEAVRDKNPGARVIIITGYASIETAVESARMGAVDYLPKPFTINEIRNVTENAFRFAA